MSISPCAYPGCRDENGDPRLTRETFCPTCQRRFYRVLGWLMLDYVTLRTQMPMPVQAGESVRSGSREYGHPREWASDSARSISDCLTATEDAIRESRLLPSVSGRRSGELVRTKSAFEFLNRHFPDVLAYQDADHVAAELEDLHRLMRSRLGQTRFVQRLPIHCPFCEVWGVVRSVGEITCGACGRIIREEHYGWLTGYVLDRLIEEYDTRKATALA